MAHEDIGMKSADEDESSNRPIKQNLPALAMTGSIWSAVSFFLDWKIHNADDLGELFVFPISFCAIIAIHGKRRIWLFFLGCLAITIGSIPIGIWLESFYDSYGTATTFIIVLALGGIFGALVRTLAILTLKT